MENSLPRLSRRKPASVPAFVAASDSQAKVITTDSAVTVATMRQPCAVISMNSPFPSQAQIVRAIKAAERAGLPVSGVRIMPDGSVVVFASQAPLVDPLAPPGHGEKNDFD